MACALTEANQVFTVCKALFREKLEERNWREPCSQRMFQTRRKRQGDGKGVMMANFRSRLAIQMSCPCMYACMLVCACECMKERAEGEMFINSV